ncbi:methyltransferase type 11 [Clostridium carboxidivorans P7]|uniref:Methyltransferase type 11 n=1 Tax=Clostridium carboxidivorans P7 TaxID=536227 RepID=C6PPI3_9CLOT|nr:class I SAM-dependent methyltransferase [Clostridium carboxidivorans]AKN33922.1 methyltransferase type 11 [Clostridium carboxidivorans P7]EET88877.1 Methyltransferase type 11 [Clostridium carboxidivorans P7]EFG88207.1 methyltransferase domain protein [Clostridium carboxidivorans P7]
MDNLKEMYKNGSNIMEYFRRISNTTSNNYESILYSYDLQSGSYRDNYYNSILHNMHKDGKKVSIEAKKFQQEYGSAIADVFNQLKYSNVLEVGVGEATTLCDVVKNLNNQEINVKGIDISFSRIGYGNIFIKEQEIKNISLGMADMFKLPFADNAFDIVFTSHCIEPNTDRAEEAVNELYRVANKWLILIEPAYDLGNEETKKHMIEHAYCTNLIDVIYKSKLNVVEHKLFGIGTYNNQAAITIIKKNNENVSSNANWSCPICKKELIKSDGNYFCEDCSTIFPIIKNIPCLTTDSAILGSKYLEL